MRAEVTRLSSLSKNETGVTSEQRGRSEIEWGEMCNWPAQAVLRCWPTWRSDAAGFGCSCSWNDKHDGQNVALHEAQCSV
jgi:hypothetical protein